MSPTISIIVPVYNESKELLSESLGSLSGQTFVDFECLLVDESSRSESSQFCLDFTAQDKRFFYIRPEARAGLAGSLNIGLSKARGEFVARFDADDVCEPGRFDRQIEMMRTRPDVDVMGSSLRLIDEQGEIVGERSYPCCHADIEKKFAYTNALAHPSVLVRRAAFEKYGIYDAEFRFAEDLELWLRMLKKGAHFANAAEPLIRYRIRAGGRKFSNWRYNIKARIRNIRRRFFLRQVLFIVALSIFSLLPGKIRVGAQRVIPR